MTVVTELVAKLSVDGVEESGRKLGGFTQTLENASGSARKWGGILSVGVTAPLILFGNQAAGTASDVNESLSKVNVVFGDSASAVTEFSKTTTEAFGISEGAALEAAGTFGTIFGGVGIAQDAAADMSTTMLGLAGDLASFNNLETGDALEKLRSGLVGEAEPLRALGVVMSEAEVTAKAMSLGLADVATELTAADKVQARYALILEKTTLAQGDAGRTIGEAAGQAKVQAAAMQDLSATIGGQLLPIKQQLLTVVSGLIEKFQNLSPNAQSIIVKVGILAAAVGPLLAVLGMVLPVLGAIGTALGVLLSPIGLIVAAIALLALAWTTNFGGIQDKTKEVWGVIEPVLAAFGKFITDTVIPAISTLVDWLGGNLKKAVDDLSIVWEKVLLPALTLVWDFITTSVMPLFTALADLVSAVLGLAIQVLAGLWENVLLPALDKVWKFIDKNVMPILDAIGAVVKKTLTPVFDALAAVFKGPLSDGLGMATTALETMKGIFDGIATVVSSVIGWIEKLTEKLKFLKLPSWLTGGGEPTGAGDSSGGGSSTGGAFGGSLFNGGGLAMPGMSGGGDYATQGRTAGQQWATAYAQAVQEHISGMGDAIAASLQPQIDYRYRRQAVGVRALA